MSEPDHFAEMDALDAAAGRPAFRDRRLSFGARADDYDRYRPGYTPAIAQWLIGDPPPDTSLRVLDLAAGTGQLGRTLLTLGHDVVAVEPDPEMRARAARRLGDKRVFAGTAESIPLSDASVDAVVVGTAWHWFDRQLAPPEIARVLKPGGRLGVAWNLRDDRVPWVSAFDELVDGQDRVMRAAEVRFESPEPWFGPADSADLPHAITIAPNDLVGLASSFSYVALRPDVNAVLESVRELVATHPDLAGRDTIEMPYVAHSFRVVKHGD